MEKLGKELTIKYAFLQSTFWISQCAISGFAVVYLTYLQYSKTSIGIILSIASILSVVIQPLIAGYADKAKNTSLRNIVLYLMGVVLLFSLLLCIVPNIYYMKAIIYVVISAIQCTLIPLFNSLATEYMNLGVPLNYGLARGISALSYAIMSYLIGFIIGPFGPGALAFIIFFTYIFVLISGYFYKLSKADSVMLISKDTSLHETYLSEICITEEKPLTMIGFLSRYKKFMFLLIGFSFLFYSHSIIGTYLITIIENVGGNSKNMGISLGISAALELPTMALFVFLVKKVSNTRLLKLASFFFFLKILSTYLARNVMAIYMAQSLQLFAFALFTPASVYYVNTIIGGKDKVKGQSLLGVATMGIAGTLANLTGGKLIDTYGVSYMLMISTVMAFIGFILCLLFTEKES